MLVWFHKSCSAYRLTLNFFRYIEYLIGLCIITFEPFRGQFTGTAAQRICYLSLLFVNIHERIATANILSVFRFSCSFCC